MQGNVVFSVGALDGPGRPVDVAWAGDPAAKVDPSSWPKSLSRRSTAAEAGRGRNVADLPSGSVFLRRGLFQVVTSIAYRKALPGGWGWMLASGVCDLLLVAIIFAYWPLSAAWMLGLLAAVNLLTSGVAIVMSAMAARDAVDTVKDAIATARR